MVVADQPGDRHARLIERISTGKVRSTKGLAELTWSNESPGGAGT